MPYNPHRNDRRSIRLKGYDYTSPGAYFLTLCTHQRQCLFGEIVDGVMHLNEWGKIVERDWLAIPNHNSHIELDEFVVMPNHFHGAIVQTFKSQTTRKINRITQSKGRTLWQRNYYEHIVRNENALHRIRTYIQMNPRSWASDQLHPSLA